jgi:hypothetical protein
MFIVDDQMHYKSLWAVKCYDYNTLKFLLGNFIYNLDCLIDVIPMFVFLVCGYVCVLYA